MFHLMTNLIGLNKLNKSNVIFLMLTFSIKSNNYYLDDTINREQSYTYLSAAVIFAGVVTASTSVILEHEAKLGQRS